MKTKDVYIKLTVAMCVEVPDDYQIDPDNLFIENETISLMDMRGGSFPVRGAKTDYI